MAEIPSDIASSAAQAGYQAHAVEGERAARRSGLQNSTDRQVKAVNESDTTVETDDADSRVYTDAEGGGSQGRSFEEPGQQVGDHEVDKPVDGLTKDPDGRLHLDLEV